jgi:hypothetical protein
MLRKTVLSLIIVLTLSVHVVAGDLITLSRKLQDVSVTVKSGLGEGSGTIITREVKTGPNKTDKMNFVWTAAHVIDNLRSVRNVIREGKSITIVEFRDAQIVQEIVENGRRVGELKMAAKVIKYSDSEDGEDLALLLIRKRNFIPANAVFHKGGDSSLTLGTELYHIGSLLGQVGSNSMTRGIISSVGRVLNLGTGDGVVFDQTTVTAFPGSSGGGVFLSERSEEKSGQYVGMLVRGAGETFNLIVPVRRLRSYAVKNNIAWAVDVDVETPSLEDILNLPIEGSATTKAADSTAKAMTPDSKMFPILPLVEAATKKEIKAK